MVECDGEATNEAIYAAIERYMGGALLSQQGRHTLRSLINRDAVRQGLVDPHGQNQGVWRITDSGRARVTDLPDEVKPEGLDTNSFDLGEYPIDSLLIRSETRTLFEVARRMSNNQYILDPDFQREFVWDETKQSKLIESALSRSLVMRNRCTMVSGVPWRTASDGSSAGSTAQRSSWVTVNVAFFLGVPRGVRTWRSASEEWSCGAGLTEGLRSGFPEPPFSRAFSSRNCWFSARRAAMSAACTSMRFSNGITI